LILIVFSALKKTVRGHPNIAATRANKETRIQIIRTISQILTKKALRLFGKWFFHQFKGLLILDAAITANRAILNGVKPPPDKSKIKKRRSNMPAPYFLLMNNPDQRIISNPLVMVKMPVIKKLGIIVMAVSNPYSQKRCSGPMAEIKEFIACLIMFLWPGCLKLPNFTLKKFARFLKHLVKTSGLHS
jgi:hypothetical protein